MTDAAAAVDTGDRADPDAPSKLSLLSDRLNPILVREVQQSLKGRAFIITMSVALAAIVVTTLAVAARGPAGQGVGMEYFGMALTLLVPIALFVIPLQACLSMQHELRGGAGEQLLLSRLTPGRIVRGKLMAAMVQFCLFASVFGPLLALTFLLRGVDVPTIAFFMVAGALSCLTASAFAIAAGAVGRARMLTTFLLAAVAIALGFLSIGLMSSMWFAVREISSEMRRGDFWLATGVAVNSLVLVLVLFGMIARSLLTHPNENRSTQFRVFAVVAILAALVWILCAVRPDEWSEAGRALAITSFVGLSLFWLFAVTEEERLSPRARVLLPKSRTLAWLTVPFVPGGGRGVAFLVFTSALVFGLAGALELLTMAAGDSPHRGPLRWSSVAMCWGYFAAYAGLGRPVRAWLRPGPVGTWTARLGVPVLVILGCTIPAFIDIMANGHVGRWSPLHITNPFFTLDGSSGRRWFVAILAFAGLVLLCNIAAMRRGVREVLEASRRQRDGDAT